MNVIIANEGQATIAGLNIDVIKSLNGCFEVDELINMFQNFYFGKMILDLTAIKDYKNLQNLQKLSMSLEVDKIILLLPPNDPECTSNAYLSQLISMGIYNFTTNLEGLEYLINHPNTYRDVAHIHQLGQSQMDGITGSGVGVSIIGIKNVTENAGSTSLIYMMKKVLEAKGVNVVAIELNKRDFQYYGEKNMVSVSAEQLPAEVMKQKEANVILVDLNDSNQEDTCGDVLYLLEPSLIRLNKLMKRDRRVFERLRGKKIVLNKSMLTGNDINDLEYESKSKIYYSIPPLNDRKENKGLEELLTKLGVLKGENSENNSHGGGLFDIFKR